MAECTKCDLCAEGSTITRAAEMARVPCNVRKFKDEVFTLWRCAGCGSVHCREDAELSGYYADYPLQRQKLTFSERIGYRNRLRLLRRHGLRPADRILDYGCGAGLFVEFLREQGFPFATGYDPFAAKYADTAILKESFDCVVSYDVIEHDDDPAGFLRRVGGLVRNGGLLVIGTPNADHVRLNETGDPSLHPPYHRHILSESALLALARKQGFGAVDIYRRSFYDSLVPTVNSRFMWRYIRKTGGFLDAAVEPPQVGAVLRSPKMVLYALLGYFLPARDYILVTFRRHAAVPAGPRSGYPA